MVSSCWLRVPKWTPATIKARARLIEIISAVIKLLFYINNCVNLVARFDVSLRKLLPNRVSNRHRNCNLLNYQMVITSWYWRGYRNTFSDPLALMWSSDCLKLDQTLELCLKHFSRKPLQTFKLNYWTIIKLILNWLFSTLFTNFYSNAIRSPPAVNISACGCVTLISYLIRCSRFPY